jgi:hypothetical protein
VNPSRIGVSSAGKRAVAAFVIVLVLGAAYLAVSLSKSGAPVSLTSDVSVPPPIPVGNQTGMYALLGPFPKMQVSVNFYDEPDGLSANESFAYAVLGTASLNLTTHTVVEFTNVGSGDQVIAWFNSTGAIDRVDVLGQKNYTGPTAYVLASAYTSAFAIIPTITNNSTLLSLLSKTSETTTSIGPARADVTTYTLGAETATYANITARYAAVVPGVVHGTTVELAVYLDEILRNRSTTLIQVTSITP